MRRELGRVRPKREREKSGWLTEIYLELSDSFCLSKAKPWLDLDSD